MSSSLIDTRDVSSRNVRLRVTEYGSGPPLLLLHGFLMSHAAWDDVVPGFAARYRVITPDLPGFGESEKPAPTRFDYGVEAFAECVADLISALSLGRPHVIGHGMSGAIAIAPLIPCPITCGRPSDSAEMRSATHSAKASTP